MTSIPDEGYSARMVSIKELQDRTYKARVNRENRNHDYTKFSVDKRECSTVIT